MKIKAYLLSFFVSAEKKIKDNYLGDLVDLHAKIISAKNCTEVYETVRIMLYAVEDKLDMFEAIKKLFQAVNYGQHKFVIDNIDGIITVLRHLNKISYIANVCKIHKREPLLSYAYISLKGRTMNDLATLQREDELTWTGDLEQFGNGAELKKINSASLQTIESNIQTIITYVEN